MRVLVKNYKELVHIATDIDENGTIEMPNEWQGFHGDGNNVPTAMQKLCGTWIDLEHWNGWQGYYDHWIWTLPMIEIKSNQHNRNKANTEVTQ